MENGKIPLVQLCYNIKNSLSVVAFSKHSHQELQYSLFHDGIVLPTKAPTLPLTPAQKEIEAKSTIKFINWVFIA